MTAVKLLLSARLFAAWWYIISDCDETYNYWEPTHYLVHGSGFQTWEYSPVYAIRSYFYIWIHSLPLQLFQTNKIIQFYILRCFLAVVCALCELLFYKGVCQQFGSNAGRLTLWFLLLSTGMYISCSAYLPSSFSMYFTLTAMGAWFLKKHQIAILSIAVSALIGWPFAGVLGIPIAFDLVFRKRFIWYFIKWSFVFLIIIMVPLVIVDSHYYGKTVIAPLNIILYNVFSGHGPEIYGTAPFSYYIVNGFLNFNIVFLLALASLPVALFVKWFVPSKQTNLPIWLTLAPLYIWISIFFFTPHKEERFLYPIYPFLALGGAVSVDFMQKFYSYILGIRANRHSAKTGWMSVSVGTIFTILCVSRSIALYQGYHAAMDIYVDLNRIAGEHPTTKIMNVCVGKEWYRFPSSFFLPDKNWHLQFIQSDFKGQLPKPYSQEPGATRLIPSFMNDLNQEEPSRYVNISECHYLVDLDVPFKSELEPRYSDSPSWRAIATIPFLDATQSHKLWRAFYVPFLSSHYCTYLDYNLLKAMRSKSRGKVKT